MRSTTSSCGPCARKPAASASSALLGFRSTSWLRTSTIGSASGVTPSCRMSDSATASLSMSTNRCGSRLRAAKERSRWVSGEERLPTMRKPAPDPISSDRRIRQARRIRSPSSGWRSARPRSRSAGIASTSPAFRATVVTNSTCPVRMDSSPRKRRGPCTLMSRRRPW